MIEYKGITLKEATLEDIPFIESYVLEDHQYADMPIKAMTTSIHETQKYPILILNEESLVGFFILQKNKLIEIFPMSDTSLFLRDHSIDERFQEKGFGKLSIEALPFYIKDRFDNIDEVVLAVDYDNLSGQMLYLKTGFKDTKKRYKEKNSFKFIYSKKLKNSSE
ncbi:MAG: GNAT family N-acetyltransferase [Carnobacterium sp.]|uniref:GNAT family N-acetyltransferase n=1 Tax=Carnobacterium sp. TMP28 TaxID=3397060 RepID=UPI001E072285|nr:GNAT family N-acetyltransferase [Carnobacterium sp.]